VRGVTMRPHEELLLRTLLLEEPDRISCFSSLGLSEQIPNSIPMLSPLAWLNVIQETVTVQAEKVILPDCNPPTTTPFFGALLVVE
jgi:hypothetical protein